MPSSPSRGAGSRAVAEPVPDSDVAASWRRCAELGLNPGSDLPTVELQDAELEAYRSAHALAPAMPVVRRMLSEHATADGLVVAVGDAAGRILWLEGHTGAVRQAEQIHFMPGARWGEADAGTNAPALALALNRPARVHSVEHLIEPVRRWSCSAAPVHHPGTGDRVGFVDVTGTEAAASASLLALVRLTVDAVEDLLGRDAEERGVDLSVLGRRDGELTTPSGRETLSRRHTEILLLLEANPAGLTADELAVLLDERTLDPVTVRAEMTRLRKAVGDGLVLSRPYRLTRPLVSDVTRLRRLVGGGRVRDAVAEYAGGVLPRSEAPGVVELRENVRAELRAAVLADGRAEVLLAWADAGGADDIAVWAAAERCLPPGSARLPVVRGRLEVLTRRQRSGPTVASPFAGTRSVRRPLG